MERVLGITPDEIQRHIEDLRKISRMVEPTLGLPVVLTDPKDDPIVYTAVSARADVLCARPRILSSQRDRILFALQHQDYERNRVAPTTGVVSVRGSPFPGMMIRPLTSFRPDAALQVAEHAEHAWHKGDDE